MSAIPSVKEDGVTFEFVRTYRYEVSSARYAGFAGYFAVATPALGQVRLGAPCVDSIAELLALVRGDLSRALTSAGFPLLAAEACATRFCAHDVSFEVLVAGMHEGTVWVCDGCADSISPDMVADSASANPPGRLEAEVDSEMGAGACLLL